MAVFQAATQIAVANTIQAIAPSKTFLAAAITTTVATSATVPVIAANGPFPAMQPGFPVAATFDIQIDSEDLTVTAGWNTATWTITRGANSTAAATHLINAPITFFGSSGFTAAPAAATVIADACILQALPQNVGAIGVGLASSGWDINRCGLLVPGEKLILSSAEAATLGAIYILGTTAGDAVAYVGE